MKKFIALASTLFIGASAFATLSANDYGGTLITGDYTAAELKAANGGSGDFANIVLNGSISITDGTGIKTTTAEKMLGASATYSLVSTGASSISLTAGSTGSFQFASAINTLGGPLEINVDKDAGGYIYVGKVTSQKASGAESAPMTLNLHKEYAIRTSSKNNAFTMTVVNSAPMNINASADQKFKIDYRAGSTVNINVTNDASLYFGLVSINKTGSTSYIVLQNDLQNGSLMFAEDMVDNLVYDSVNNVYNLNIILNAKSGEVFTQTLQISGADGVDISNLTWSNTVEEGYWTLTGFSAAVPEPAEWAMILGALALGWAIYRRK